MFTDMLEVRLNYALNKKYNLQGNLVCRDTSTKWVTKHAHNGSRHHSFVVDCFPHTTKYTQYTTHMPTMRICVYVCVCSTLLDLYLCVSWTEQSWGRSASDRFEVTATTNAHIATTQLSNCAQTHSNGFPTFHV